MSYENIVGLVLSILLALYLSRRPAVPGEVLVSTTTAGIIFLVVLVVALVAVHVPLGDYMYRVYTSEKDLYVERVIYRLIGVDARSEQTWAAYARSVLAFSSISILSSCSCSSSYRASCRCICTIPPPK